MNSPLKKELPALRKLYPDYTPEELEEAEYTLRRYTSLVWRIYQRLKRDNPEILTGELLNARFKQFRK